MYRHALLSCGCHGPNQGRQSACAVTCRGFLATITLNQLADPGAPVVYGSFGSNVDLKSGALAFDTTQHIQMLIRSGQLARHIGLPGRSAAGAASNTNDIQAPHETEISVWGCLQANATMVIYSAGWLEGGLTFDFENLIQGIGGLQSIAHLCKLVGPPTPLPLTLMQ